MTPRSRSARRALRVAWTVLGSAILAGGTLLLTVGPPATLRTRPLAVVHEAIPGAAPDRRALRPDEPYVRVVRLGALERAALDRVPLVPDPRARRTFVVPASPARVLDPGAVRVWPLAVPRRDRPLALSVRIETAQPEDRVRWRAGGAFAGVDGSVRSGTFRGVCEIDPMVAPGTELEIEWSGRRAGRAGRVTVRYGLTPLPPPRVWFGPGVRRDGPTAQALSLQGFPATEQRTEAALVVLDLGREAPPGLAPDVDRGLGCLLLGEPGRGVHPSFRSIAPVVAAARPVTDGPAADGEPVARAGPGTPESRDEKSGKREAERQPAQTQRPERAPAGQKEPGLRRTGGVGASERARAIAARKRVETRKIALVLLLDRSGSMRLPAATPRMDMAKQGALATAATLGEGDEFALVTFGSRVDVVIPLGPANRRQELRRVLRGLRADADSTECYPGLERSWEILKRSGADVRHIVILTDGEFLDGARPYPRLARSLRQEGIGLSGLGVLPAEGELGATQFAVLRDFLRAGGGQLLVTAQATEIPRLLIGEVREVVGAARPLAAGPGEKTKPDPAAPSDEAGPPAERAVPRPTRPPPKPPETPSRPAAHPLHAVDVRPVLAGLEDVAWPDVAGYLPLEASVRARVHLAVGTRGHAFLATAPYGLGHVAVLAGGDGPPWSGALVAHPAWSRLLGQLAGWLLPPRAAGVERSDLVTRRSARVLAGDGPQAAVMAEAARRVGGRVVEETELRPGRWTSREPGEPAVWICALLAAFLLLLVLETLIRRSR